ncbi:MAG: BrnT family toxin [Candidatus Rokubacteria bacterium]|nr:BrnT family toxin [Candidatus Rokubacteria bacterium]
MGFEWNDQKEAENLENHGIDFRESIEAFDDPLALVRADPDHSRDEHRFIIIGHSKKGRVLLTVFKERRAEVRIISSRRATRREVRDYEEGI